MYAPDLCEDGQFEPTGVRIVNTFINFLQSLPNLHELNLSCTKEKTVHTSKARRDQGKLNTVFFAFNCRFLSCSTEQTLALLWRLEYEHFSLRILTQISGAGTLDAVFGETSRTHPT